MTESKAVEKPPVVQEARPTFDARPAGCVRGHHLRSLAELQADFAWRRGRTFRPLEALTRDFERRQRVRGARPGKAKREAEPRLDHAGVRREAAESPADRRVYDRIQLLVVYAALAAAPKASKEAAAALRAEPLPTPTTTAARSAEGECSYEQDPRLDDETIIAAIETRLSCESGADAANVETFGTCSAGWTFEEALRAIKTHSKAPAAAAGKHTESRHVASATTSGGEEHASESSGGECEDSWELPGLFGAITPGAALPETRGFGALGTSATSLPETEGFGALGTSAEVTESLPWELGADDAAYAANEDGLGFDCSSLGFLDAWYEGCEEWGMGHEVAGQCYDYEYLNSEQMWGDGPFFPDGSDMYKSSCWSDARDVNRAGAERAEYLDALAASPE